MSISFNFVTFLNITIPLFLSLGHTQNVVLGGENGIALMKRLFFRMVENTLQMDKRCLLIVVVEGLFCFV